MKTVKLPYRTDENGRSFLLELRRLQSVAIRISYNEHFKGNSDVKSITDKIKSYGIELPSTFILYAIREGKSIYETEKAKKEELKTKLSSQFNKLNEQLVSLKSKKSKKRFYKYEKTLKKLIKVKKRLKALDSQKTIFGGRKVFFDRCKGNISHEEFQSRRMSNLIITGETLTHGNRHCTLDMDKRTLTIRVDRHSKLIVLNLPKNFKNLEEELRRLADECKECKNKFSVEVSNCFTMISYEEFKKDSYEKHFNRVLAFDDNPNYIGLSVTDWDSKDDLKPSKVIYKEVIDKKDLIGGEYIFKKNGKTRFFPNCSKNKVRYETFIIVKHIVQLAKHFKCVAIAREELVISSSDKGKGKFFNKLCNNDWNRDRFSQNLKKRCFEHGIDLIEVNPANSSKLGNVLYGEDNGSVPDMVASSIEIARRSFHYHKVVDRKSGKQSFYFNKGEKLYPEWDVLKNGLNRWKEKALQSPNREEFFKSLVGQSYRAAFREIPDVTIRTSLNNSKSRTILYCFK